MIKAVIFDMDGVIVDSEPAHIRAEKQILLKHGVKVTTEELRAYTGATAEFEFADLIRKYKLNTTVDALFKEKEGILFKLLKREMHATRGVVELIKSLKAQRVKLGIASSGHRKLVHFYLTRLKLANRFDSVTCAEDITHSKPHPEIFLKSAKELGVRPDECAVIEDSKLGVEAAKSAGMKCVGYRNPNSGDQDLSQADIIVDDFTGLDIRSLLHL